MPQKAKKTRVDKHRAHVKRLHKLRVVWFGVLIFGLAFVQVAYHVQQASASSHGVLAYATSMSIGDLATLTNQQRAQYGKPALQLNSKLNTGAQNKANDMIAKDYWSHVSPDGTQPWYFFTSAGYAYSSAGENLAYGFDTSAGAIDGWMNSPGHRANMLGDYKEMGFGIADGPNYQGGPHTVVVAFYGVPSSTGSGGTNKSAPAQKSTAAAPAPKTTTKAPAAPAQPAPAPAPAPVTEPEKPVAEPVAPLETHTAESPKRVTNISALGSGNATWATVASVGLVGATSIGFATTHRELVRREWKKGKKFIVFHPLLDVVVLGGIAIFILSSTAGFIK